MEAGHFCFHQQVPDAAGGRNTYIYLIPSSCQSGLLGVFAEKAPSLLLMSYVDFELHIRLLSNSSVAYLCVTALLDYYAADTVIYFQFAPACLQIYIL